MDVTRRKVIGGLLASGALASVPGLAVAAQDGTPAALPGTPGYGIARVRVLPSPELNQAIFPDVLTRFLPATRAVPGYAGYLFAWHDTDPATSVTLTLLEREADAAGAEAAAADYVGSLDEQFIVETPFAVEGTFRFWMTADPLPASTLPHLHNCAFTMRERYDMPGADIEALLAHVEADLAPTLRAMPGFIMYAWMAIDGGRVALNIWETVRHQAAGDAIVADWVAHHAADTVAGATVVTSGRIGFAELPGLTPDLG